jgi:hypothetical protein
MEAVSTYEMSAATSTRKHGAASQKTITFMPEDGHGFQTLLQLYTNNKSTMKEVLRDKRRILSILIQEKWKLKVQYRGVSSGETGFAANGV